MLVDITELPLEEPARFNPGQLEALCDKIGELRAETEVAHALDRLSSHLTVIGKVAAEHQFELLDVTLTGLISDSSLIGMATLARVAQDVQACMNFGDQTALAATLARLQRVGDRSIHAVWDLEDVSG